MLKTFSIVDEKKKFSSAAANSINRSKTGFVNVKLKHTHAKQETKRSNKTFVTGIQPHRKTACTAHCRTHTHIAASQIEKCLVCSTKV